MPSMRTRLARLIAKIEQSLTLNENVEVRLRAVMDDPEPPTEASVRELLGETIIDPVQRWHYQCRMEDLLNRYGCGIDLGLTDGVPDDLCRAILQTWVVAFAAHMTEELEHSLREKVYRDILENFDAEDLDEMPEQREKLIAMEILGRYGPELRFRLSRYDPEELWAFFQASFTAGWSKMPTHFLMSREKFLKHLGVMHAAGQLNWLLPDKDKVRLGADSSRA